MPYVYFLLICAIWGSNFLLMKKAGAAFGPLSIGGLRALGGAAVLAAIWAAQSRRWPLERRHVPALLLVALVGYAWPYAVQPYLVGRHGSGFIGMTVSLVPILTIVVAVPLLGIRPTPRQAAGVLGGLVCLGLILSDGWQRRVPAADLALAGSVPLVYALSNIWTRKRLHDVPPLPLACLILAISAVALLPAGAATEAVRTEKLPWAIAAVAVLGPLGTGLSNYWFTRLLQEHGPLFAGMVTYLVPVGAVTWGWIDQERVTPLQLVALAGVFAMVSLVQYGAARSAVPPPAGEAEEHVV
jgi:drug/metabolite transporter (DMT)-like permease